MDWGGGGWGKGYIAHGWLRSLVRKQEVLLASRGKKREMVFRSIISSLLIQCYLASNKEGARPPFFYYSPFNKKIAPRDPKNCKLDQPETLAKIVCHSVYPTLILSSFSSPGLSNSLSRSTAQLSLPSLYDPPTTHFLRFIFEALIVCSVGITKFSRRVGQVIFSGERNSSGDFHEKGCVSFSH